MDEVKTMIYDQDLPMHLWAKAKRTVVYVQNRISPTMEISRKRKPAWAREIIQEAERYGAPEGSTRISKNPKPHFPTM